MASFAIDPETVTVHLTTAEKVSGILTDQTFPRTSISSVEVVADGLAAAHGLRCPGLNYPRHTKIGTWLRRGRGRSQLLVVRRGIPAVRLTLTGQRFGEVLISTPDAAQIVAALTVPPAAAASSLPRTVVTSFTSAGMALVGDLVLAGDRRVPGPAVLLLAGSGPIDRNGNHQHLRLDIQRQLAGALADAGIHSLRYDKRGMGASSGDYWATGLADNIHDAAAALEHLRSRPEVDPTRIVVVGHSEGALLAAAILATSNSGSTDGQPHAAGAVLLSGTATNGEELLVWQAKGLAADLPRSTRAILKVLRKDLVSDVRRNHAKVKATTTATARLGGARVNALWLREFMAYDPTPDLAGLAVPVLALTGAKDCQVPVTDLDVIAATVPPPVTTLAVPDISHILRTQTGPATVRTYRTDVRRTVAPTVIEQVVAWVSAQLNSGAAASSEVNQLTSRPR